MSSVERSTPPALRDSPVRVVFGAGALGQLGELAAGEGAGRVLLVTDSGIVAAGHAGRAEGSLEAAGLHVTVFDGAHENPTTEHVAEGLGVAAPADVDFIVGVGGGSAMDCAKGINLLLTNGGRIADYWGVNKASKPMLPLMAVPTTAGTGSEAQSFALISDPVTHQKMACGDRRLPSDGGLRPRVAVLDPDLTRTQPRRVALAAGFDAVAHAIETAGCNARSDVSRAFSRSAWALLEGALERVVAGDVGEATRADMLLGAHLAGAAIEASMLGAAHACANPLTARFGMVHGEAVSVMLPHVLRFNAGHGGNPYADLVDDAYALAARLEQMLRQAGLFCRLTDAGIKDDAVSELAKMAADQWTARFNPVPVGAVELGEIYRSAL